MFKVLSVNCLLSFSLLLFTPLSGSVQHQDATHTNPSPAAQQLEEVNHEAGEAEEEAFDPSKVIMDHIADEHGFHLWGEGHNALAVPLPVILYTKNGLVSFSSSAFHHDTKGHHIVEKGGMQFVNLDEKIYRVDESGGHLQRDEEGNITNLKPLDFSITKNVFTLFFASVIILLIFVGTARSYSKQRVPKKLASFMEPLILFVRDDIARPNVGAKYERFLPYLLTLFFFIWVVNLMGLIPFFPFSANLSGNISFTITLAVIALFVVNLSGNAQYWKHILLPKPLWLLPILLPIELLSNVVTKFFALMVRLMANITAGHIAILSLVSLIFIFETVAASAVAIPFALFISVLELLVAALQAFIFTLLVALFIGQATAEETAH